MDTKTCTLCHTTKPLSEFSEVVIHKRRADARTPEVLPGTRHDVCRSCVVVEALKRYSDSGGSLKVLEAMKRYADKEKP